MSKGLTDLLIRRIASPPKGKRLEIADERLPGFSLRVTHNGVKTFVLRYRHRGILRRLTLGQYSATFTLANARQKATEALVEVQNGKDPAFSEVKMIDENYHFENVLDVFVAKHCKVHNKESTAAETERLLRSNFLSRWTKRDIRDLTQGQIEKVLDEIIEAGSPSSANHAFVALRTMLNWCVGRRLITASPCTHMKLPAKTESRSRVLRKDELRSVWASFDPMGYPFGTMGKLLLLTGQRRGEVTELRWEHLDLTERLWKIPKELSKNGEEHLVPLSEEVVRILKAVPRLDDKRVFPARGNPENAISGFSKAKRELARLSNTSGWTFHDLRRTVSTGMGEIGILPHVIERILNHSSGQLGGVAGIYNRYRYLPEMREALEKWAMRIISIAGSSSEVTAMGVGYEISSTSVELQVQGAASGLRSARHERT